MPDKNLPPTATMFAPDDGAIPYRLNVGLVIFNRKGQVFLAERKKETGAWQLPQGGIKQGQSREEAALAELREETGITDAAIIAAMPAPLDYDFPDYVKKEGRYAKYRGQRQYWFAILYTGPDSAVRLQNEFEPEEAEFKAWRWGTLDEAVALIVDFKKPVYEKVVAWARPLAEKLRGNRA